MLLGLALLVVLPPPLAHAKGAQRIVDLQSGEVRRSFVLERRLGSGYWSVGYLAKALDDGERVAIKMLRPLRLREGKSDSYDKEVDLLRRAASPALQRAYGVGLVRGAVGRRAMVMPLFDGYSLFHMPDGPRAPGKAVRIVMQVLRALAGIHAAGFRHNDVHPGNVFLKDESSATVKLLDASEAVPISSTVHNESNWDEPGKGPVAPGTVTSDIYNVGAVLAFTLTGRYPRRDKQGIVEAVPDLKANDHADAVSLRDIVRKAMHPDPTQRYPTAQAMIDALRPFSTL